MGIMALATPLGLGILAFSMFYMAFKHREQERFGRFEILFVFGNLFLLAAMYVIYSVLAAGSVGFASTMLPIFQAFMWIYVLINIVMFFKLLKNFIWDIWKFRGKGYING